MTTPRDNTRDIVIRLDTELKQVQRQLGQMSHKVDEMHSLLQQAKGVKWMILAMAAIGGFVSAKLSPFIPWFK